MVVTFMFAEGYYELETLATSLGVLPDQFVLLLKTHYSACVF